jgi:electron transport complex protein RnfG
MRDMIRLFAAVVLFSGISGGLLGTLRAVTKDRIEYQQLKFVKGPAIVEILRGCANDPLADRFKVKDGEKERTVYVGVFHGKANTVVLESSGKGYDGDIGLVVAVNLENDRIAGVGVTTLRETPGVGARVKTEPSFTGQFKGLSVVQPVKMKSEGGRIDALSGATFSSRGVVAGVSALSDVYKRLKPEIMEKMKSIRKS